MDHERITTEFRTMQKIVGFETTKYEKHCHILLLHSNLSAGMMEHKHAHVYARLVQYFSNIVFLVLGG